MIFFEQPKLAPSNYLIATTKAINNVSFKSEEQSQLYYDQIRQIFNIEEIFTLNQIHSSAVFDFNDIVGTNTPISGDGLYVSLPNVTCGIKTADCYPVVLIGNSSYAVLHCGWRGIFDNILLNALQHFKSNNDFPHYAYIGVGISKDYFEVKSDFIERAASFINITDLFISNYMDRRNGKIFFDLRLLIHDILIENNVYKIEICDRCSYESLDYHSYRRDLYNAGRMLTIVTSLY